MIFSNSEIIKGLGSACLWGDGMEWRKDLFGVMSFAAGVDTLIAMVTIISLRANTYWLFTIHQVTFQWHLCTVTACVISPLLRGTISVPISQMRKLRHSTQLCPRPLL